MVTENTLSYTTVISKYKFSAYCETWESSEWDFWVRLGAGVKVSEFVFSNLNINIQTYITILAMVTIFLGWKTCLKASILSTHALLGLDMQYAYMNLNQAS